MTLCLVNCGSTDRNANTDPSDGASASTSAGATETSGDTFAGTITGTTATNGIESTTGSNVQNVGGTGVGGSGTTSAASTTGVSAEGLPLEQLPTVYSGIYCDWVFRCCPEAQIAHLTDAPISFVGNTQAECETNYAAFLLLLIPQITEAEGQGRSHYNPQLAADCMAAIPESCEYPEALCQPFIEPLVPPGGACTQDSQCMEGLHCINEADDTDGTCAELLEIGEACERERDCASDACSTTCTEKEVIGGTCYVDNTCASGYCDFSTDTCAEAPYTGACDL